MTDRCFHVNYKGTDYEMFQKMDKTRMNCELCEEPIKKGDFYSNPYDGPGPCCEKCMTE